MDLFSAPVLPAYPASLLMPIATHDQSPVAEVVRRQLTANLADKLTADIPGTTRSEHGEIHRAALRAARESVFAMRAHDEIGDDAFHQIEEELDWLEMAIRSKPD